LCEFLRVRTSKICGFCVVFIFQQTCCFNHFYVFDACPLQDKKTDNRSKKNIECNFIRFF
jgi:hypothetical protein